MTETPTPADVFGWLLMMFAVFMLSVTLWFGWALVAPRDPGGMLCDGASPVRSLGAMLRGKVETGCAWHNKPIVEE
jgi:hypothetical protein